MTRVGRLTVAALVAAMPLAASDARFAAAVLRADGGLVPIGTFTGRKWELSWPADPVDQIDIPLTIGNVPSRWWGRLGVRQEWQVWAGGKPGGTARLLRPAVLPTLCKGRIGLMTDYQPAVAPPPPPNVQPYPKVGLAVSPPTAIDAIRVLDATAPEWRGVGDTLKQAFDKAEDELSRHWLFAGDPHPIDRAERVKTALTIEAMYASGESATGTYYVEASRKYDHSGDSRRLCAVAFGGAYFRRDGGGLKPLGVDLRVVPCTRRGLVYMLPLGAVRAGDRTFWLAQFSNWDFEQYNIIEFGRDHAVVVASTYGGSC